MKLFFIKCSDTVGWRTGRASGLYKLSHQQSSKCSSFGDLWEDPAYMD